MHSRKLYLISVVLVIASLVLSACGAPAPTATPTQVPTTVAPTTAPTAAPTQVPTMAPTTAPTPAPTTAPAAAAESKNTPRLRQLDFAPFDAALTAFTADRAAQIDAIVKDADIAQVQAAVKAGQLTYEELTLYFLARIKQYDETLRATLELNPDALNEAQAADQLLKAGKATNLMLGIPVTLKDNIETAAPLHTTGGSQILLNNQPKADASFVKQLREAGAVILGKANLSEFAGGINILPPGSSAVGGLTQNPHNTDFSAGGSSSGSGAGTAAYETMVSVGSETAGSLILPASWNGVVGMYPSKGVVDGTNVIPLVKNNDSAGPIGRSVKDVAALLSVIDTKDTDYVAGLDPKALNGVKAAFLKADVLATPPNFMEDSTDNAAIAQLIEQSLTKAGAQVSDIELSPAQIGAQLNAALGVLIAGGIRHDLLPYLTAAGAPVKTPEDLAAYNLQDPQTRIPFKQSELDATVADTSMKDAAEYQDLVPQVKAAAAAALDKAFADSKADVLVSVNNYHSAFYAIANYPAISVPLGKRANGMPVGVTLIGKPGGEAKLLAYAYALEQATQLRVDPDLSKLNAATSATSTKFGTAWQSVPCESINVAKSVAAVADCGYVTVPENRVKGGDKTIQLAVVRVKSTGQKPGTPVFLGTGGPGGYGLASIQTAVGDSWIPAHAGILADRDYVLFSQRGTKGAKPELNCPEYDLIDFQTALEGWNVQQVTDQISKTLTACRDKFAAQGVDFSAYNSDENAADIKDIAQALGYAKIDYYGQSYGTMLGQFLMRNHPEILEAVILDGVAQVKNISYAQMVNLQDSFRRVFDACQADADCKATYPDLENTLTQVYNALQKNPAPVVVALGNETATLQVNGNMILNGLIGPMYGGGAGDVPNLIYALKANSPLAVKKLAPSLPSPINANARLMHFAVNCSDDPVTSDEPAQKDLLAMYANYAREDNRKVAVACQVLNVPQLSDASDAAVTSDLPVLIINGGLDPVTPTSNGQVIADTLPNSQMVVIPGAGHTQDGNACARDIMKAFMENPSAKVDTSCLPAKPVFNLPIKAEVKTEDGKATLRLTLPAGFTLKDPNRWVLNGGNQNVIVKAFPAGTTAADALNAYVKTQPFNLKDVPLVDGPQLDGNPTKVLEKTTELAGSAVSLKYYALEGKQGTFVVAWLNTDPASEADYQKLIVEPIVQSIKLGQ